jgi:predicted mannosyl-3-phosphoglycerate phosphatase (HAD superfamily)
MYAIFRYRFRSGMPPYLKTIFLRGRMRQRVVFVDVDDTLVRSVGTKRIPMPPVVARVRELHRQGVALYLRSSGGAGVMNSFKHQVL